MFYILSLNPALDKTIVVDRLVYEEVNIAREIYLDPAGKGVNVSKTLKNLGKKSKIIGFLGGETGRIIEELLKKEGIENDFIKVDGETRVNLTIFDSHTKKTIKINEEGPFIAPSKIKKLISKIKNLTLKPEYFIITGSLPPGVPEDIYKEIIAILKAQDIKVVLDTDKEALKKGILASPYLIKPNLAEFNRLRGKELNSPESMIEEALDIINKGVKIVVITLGKNGAILISKEDILRVIPPRVKVKGTIGAGDAFLAGLIMMISKSNNLGEALRFACACGSATVMKPGTSVSNLKEAEDLLKKVTLKEIR